MLAITVVITTKRTPRACNNRTHGPTLVPSRQAPHVLGCKRMETRFPPPLPPPRMIQLRAKFGHATLASTPMIAFSPSVNTHSGQIHQSRPDVHAPPPLPKPPANAAWKIVQLRNKTKHQTLKTQVHPPIKHTHDNQVCSQKSTKN